MDRSFGAVGAVAVVIVAAVAVVSAGGVPLGENGEPATDAPTATPAESTETPDDPTATPDEATDTPGALTATPDGATTASADESAGGTTFVHDGDRLTLAALENETVRGETDLAPGTELRVRLASESGGSPFLVQETATVGDDGTFAVTVDLVGVGNGTAFTATVRHGDESVATAEGVVVGGENDASPVDETAGNSTAASPNETDRVSDEDYDTTLDYEGDVLTLASAPDRTVGGETDLTPGTNVTVQLQSTAASSPFLQSATATVAEDGRFAAEFNTTGLDPGTEFEVTVRHDGETLALADGEVVE